MEVVRRSGVWRCAGGVLFFFRTWNFLAHDAVGSGLTNKSHSKYYGSIDYTRL